MRFLVIIPAHNEEASIGLTLKSLLQQEYQDFKVIVVDDGSSDRTKDIASTFINLFADLKIISLPPSKHSPGAKVVDAFNKGLEEVNLSEFDIICKFDADIIFPNDYLSRIASMYQANSKLGIASGLVYITKRDFDQEKAFDFSQEQKELWSFENISSKRHVRGPIKSYRRECFEEMDGLRSVLGWDNIDVLLSRMHNWEIDTDKELWVKHLRPTANKYRNEKAKKLGFYFYNIGLDFPLTVISALKAAYKGRSISDFFITIKSFLKCNHPRVLTANEMKFIRNFRWNEMQRSLFK